MPKDLKIGMVTGVVIVTIAALWMASQKAFSIKTRMAHSKNALNIQQKTDDRNNLTYTSGPPPFEETAHRRIHIVEQGETLSEISVIYYGSQKQRQKILEANKNLIDNENRIQPGTHLIIPD